MSRIYLNFPEALSEIQRDLREMGIKIHPRTVQDINVEGNPDYDAFEIQNYTYTVIEPRYTELEPTQPWADAEFEERISEKVINPGEAYKLREDVWETFLHDGYFAYTYSERMHIPYNQIRGVIETLSSDPDSRQAYISIWDPMDIHHTGGVSRIPCSLGYLFQIRGGTLHLSYLQRSADFALHFVNDIYLAYRMQVYIASALDVPVGRFNHWVGSLHIFAKNVEGVF